MRVVKFKSQAQRRKHRHQQHRPLGSEATPRLAVFRSLRYLQCQVIDDQKGHTLCSVSSRQLGLTHPNQAAATQVGTALAAKLQKLGIKKVVFDRSGYLFTGRIAALAKAVQAAGIKF